MLEEYQKVNKLTWILFLGIFSIVIGIYYIKPVLNMIEHHILEDNMQTFLLVYRINYDMYACDYNLSGNCFYLYDKKIYNIFCEPEISDVYSKCYYSRTGDDE